MLPHDVAEMLEGYAREAEQLPGVSRTNPHAFGEAKSDFVAKLRTKAKELRTQPHKAARPAGAIQPGVRRIGRRDVSVEIRRSA